MSTTVEVLREARALMADEKDWFAGVGCGRGGWCALTALGRRGGRTGEHMDAVARAMGVVTWRIPDFNDSHSHAEVLAAFDEAIANEAAREQEFTVTPEPARA